MAAAPALCQQPPPPEKGALSTHGCRGEGMETPPTPHPTHPWGSYGARSGFMGPEASIWDQECLYGPKLCCLAANPPPTPPQAPTKGL